MARRCVNKVELIGFVGKDPIIRYAPSGEAIASLSIATTDYWTDKNTKEKKERTEWHRCVAFGKFAEEVVGKLPREGSYIRVEGTLRTRKWRDEKAGVDRYTTEIVIDDLLLLDKAPTDKPHVGNPPDDEIPF